MLSANDIGRRAVLDPAFGHARLAAWLAGEGWRPAGGVSLAPVVPGEPEATTWGWPGSAVLRVGTSFNPLLPLRALDLTWVPPTWRRRFVADLPVHDAPFLEGLLAGGTARERRYAAAALAEIEATGSAAALQRAATGGTPDVARAATVALDALRRIVTAQTVTEASLAALQPQAVAACARLLVPGTFDLTLAEVAAPEVADPLAELYRAPPAPLRPGVNTPCTVKLAPAFALRSPGVWADRLSPAWRLVAPWLRDGPIWAQATWTAGGRVVTRAEGIVFSGNRMGWFPRLPLRIAEIVGRRGIHVESGPAAN